MMSICLQSKPWQNLSTKLLRYASSQSQLYDMLVYSNVKNEEKERKWRQYDRKKPHQERIDIDLVKTARQSSTIGNVTGENIPVALQFLFENSTKVQGRDENGDENYNEKQSETTEDVSNFFPFALFDDFKQPEKSHRSFGRRGRRRKNSDSPASETDYDQKFASLEKTEYEIISDKLDPEEAKKMLSDDEIFKYGTADPNIPTSKVPCGKCGAFLHCQDPRAPGFMPVEVFKDKKREDLRHLSCQRCYIMETYNIALKMSVSPENYPKAIGHIRKKKAIVVLVVDLTDFPGSVWPDIMNLIGREKRVVLVGNKVDLLPQDCPKYLSNVRRAMEKSFFKKCKESGLGFTPKIFESILVSARTGFNVEYLVSKIFKFWQDFEAQVGGDIYLVGTTNVGKSSIFNLLLDSDLCKVKAINRVEKALTSPVPGTTLHLLKFPIMRPSPERLSLRVTRLIQDRKVMSDMERGRIEMLRAYKDRRFASPLGLAMRNTFTYNQDKQAPLRSTGFSIDAKKPIYESVPKRLDPNRPEFADGHWCYDTPGSVSDDQIINILTQEEVVKLIPQLPIDPKTFSLVSGRTIFIGGVARVDIVEGPVRGGYRVPVLITVFTSDHLPINVVETADADAFYAEALKSNFLEVPSGNSERLAKFPELQGEEFSVDGYSEHQSAMDIVLSSAGWVSFSPKPADLFTVRAWTPNGKGIFVRDPPFLPYAVQLKGKRMSGTPAYKSHEIFIPQI